MLSASSAQFIFCDLRGFVLLLGYLFCIYKIARKVFVFKMENYPNCIKCNCAEYRFVRHKHKSRLTFQSGFDMITMLGGLSAALLRW